MSKGEKNDLHHMFPLSGLVRFSLRLGKVSFRQVLNLMNYMTNETETAPITEALSQLMHILRMLEKRQDLLLVGRMKVSHLNTLDLRPLANMS